MTEQDTITPNALILFENKFDLMLLNEEEKKLYTLNKTYIRWYDENSEERDRDVKAWWSGNIKINDIDFTKCKIIAVSKTKDYFDKNKDKWQHWKYIMFNKKDVELAKEVMPKTEFIENLIDSFIGLAETKDGVLKEKNLETGYICYENPDGTYCCGNGDEKDREIVETYLKQYYECIRYQDFFMSRDSLD